LELEFKYQGLIIHGYLGIGNEYKEENDSIIYQDGSGIKRQYIENGLLYGE